MKIVTVSILGLLLVCMAIYIMVLSCNWERGPMEKWRITFPSDVRKDIEKGR